MYSAENHVPFRNSCKCLWSRRRLVSYDPNSASAVLPGCQCTGSGYTSSVTGNRKTKRAGASFESPGTLAVGGRAWPRRCSCYTRTRGGDTGDGDDGAADTDTEHTGTRIPAITVTGPYDSIFPNGKYLGQNVACTEPELKQTLQHRHSRLSLFLS